MPLLSELERASWDKRTKALQQNPRTALLAAADDIEAKHGFVNVRHIIVTIVDNVHDEVDVIHVYQAGDMELMASEGALARAISILQQGES